MSRQEPFIDYQFIKDQKNWPDAAKAQTVASPQSGQNTAGVVVGKQTVVWSGSVTPDKTGTHKFRLYSSSYVKVFADGKEVLSRWRQNWNPWFHNFELPMTAGKPVTIRIEWEPNAGYLALYHSDPLPPPDRNSLWLSSDVGQRDRLLLSSAARNMDDVDRGLSRADRQGRDDAATGPMASGRAASATTRRSNCSSVVREYRKRQIPIDNIVQDWFYWPEDQWGCHCFDAKRFPDPVGDGRRGPCAERARS